MKILFVGFGSIAKKHLNTIRKIDASAQFFSISRDQNNLICFYSDEKMD